jgi:hypothetical protein
MECLLHWQRAGQGNGYITKMVLTKLPGEEERVFAGKLDKKVYHPKVATLQGARALLLASRSSKSHSVFKEIPKSCTNKNHHQ